MLAFRSPGASISSPSDAATWSAWYWPTTTGPALWLEPPDDATLDRDCVRARRIGVTELRLPLYWDSFVTGTGTLRGRRVRDAERVLRAAGRAGLRVALVALPIALGRDAVLPRFAIDRRGRGARCLFEQRVERGAPRDPFADPLLQEAMVSYLEQLGHAFANHPSLSVWEVTVGISDLVQPSDPSEASRLAGLLVATLRRTGDRVRWTLSSRECLRDQGLRPAEIGALVDELAVDAAGASRLLRAGGAAARPAPGPPPGGPAFLARLAAGLSGRPVLPVGVTVPVGASEPSRRDADAGDADPGERVGLMPEQAALTWARASWAALAALARADAVSCGAGPLLDAGPRCAELPYYRADPRRRWTGLLCGDGTPKPWAQVAAAAIGAEGAGTAAMRGEELATTPAPPPPLTGLPSPEAFYAASESALDLAGPWFEAFAAWLDEAAGAPH
ncbi:MAG TPA: hypothetical protein VMW47_11835 [Verrucomicrobiae bacterium]|nr:hypothetical protein [Verrucomicrobiae bacterium]